MQEQVAILQVHHSSKYGVLTKMAWGKAGSKTLDSTDDAISVTSMSANDTFQYMSHIITSSTFGVYDRYNDVSSGNLYHGRYETNGKADQPFQANQIYSMLDNSGGTSMSAGDYFNVSYMLNLPTEEKMTIGFSNMAQATGTGSYTTSPKRNWYVGKFDNSDQITSVSNTNISAGDYLTDSNLTVLGSELTPAVAVPAIDNVQDNSLFVEKENARRYWLTPQTVDTEEAFSFTTTDTVNALWGNRIYGMKLLSGHSGLNKYIKKIKTYHPTNPTGSRLTTGTLYHVILDSSGTEIARSAGVSASSVSNNSWAETTLSTPVKLEENYTVGVTISTGSGSSYLGTAVNNNSSSPTNTTRYYKDESGTESTSTSETILMVFDSDPATGISIPATWIMQPTFEDNTFSSGWTSTDPTNVNTNTTTKVIDANVPSTGAQTGVLTYPLGYTLENNFVLEFKMEITSYTDNTDNTHQEIYIGMTNNTSAYNVSQQFIGMSISNAASGGNNDRYALQEFYNEALTANNGQGDSTNRPNANDIRYHRISKSGSTLTYSIYSDSSYSTLVETISGTATDTYSLNTISVKLRALDGTQNGVLTVEIDDIKIYNGVGTVN